MQRKPFEVQAQTPFSESLIWELNRDYYKDEGIEAWSSGAVPHHLTSNAVVGKVYAELIYGVLVDLAEQGKTTERVYLLELGAGHGRLGFLILIYLERLLQQTTKQLPPYCYVLSDIVENNLQFFMAHPQFQPYFEQGLLDVSYFDAIHSTKLALRKSGEVIEPASLVQPLIVLANYFFDSIPSELFYVQEQKISRCSVSLESSVFIGNLKAAQSLEQLELKFQTTPNVNNLFEEKEMNQILEQYKQDLSHTFLFFPHIGMRCIHQLEQLSQQGVILLSMDKGYKDLHDLDHKKAPEMIVHGSMSFWVNYHALEQYCHLKGGHSLFPSFSTFYLQLGCLFFLKRSDQFPATKLAYHRFVDHFGPDDYNGFKRFAYQYITRMTLVEMIGMIRLSAYDSTFFINILPRLKQVIKKITVNERTRIKQVLDETWKTYFSLKEPYDLAFEIGGLLYTLGYYTEALTYFDHSLKVYGHTPDEYYNRILCYYQLREDHQFIDKFKEAKLAFPDYERWEELDRLDLGAK